MGFIRYSNGEFHFGETQAGSSSIAFADLTKASANSFDNSTNGMVSTTVQAAITEVNAFVKVLTGWTSSPGTVTSSDSVLSALQKIDGNVAAKLSTSRTISTTSPITGGGDLTANRTFSISQSNTSTNGYLSSTDWNTFNNKQSALTPIEVSSVISATAGTGSDVLLTGMTSTPASGTYLVWFSCDLNSITAGVVIGVSIYVGGIQKTDSLRKTMPFSGGTLTSGSQRVGVYTNGQVTVNGSQAIEIRWSTSAGAPTAASRTMNLLKIS